MIIDDAELDKTFIYFWCAYYFHWSPEQVDNTESYLLECLMTMLPLWKIRQQEMI